MTHVFDCWLIVISTTWADLFTISTFLNLVSAQFSSPNFRASLHAGRLLEEI